MEVTQAQVADFTDPLAGLSEKPQAVQTAVPVTRTVDGFDDLSGLMENKETQVTSEQVTPVITEVTGTEETQATEEVNAVAKEQKEFIDVLIESVVNPMVDELGAIKKALADRDASDAERNAELKELRVAVVALQKELKVQELQIQEDKIPQASNVAILKEYINSRLGGTTTSEANGTFGKAIDSNDDILARKPAENKLKSSANTGTFSGFLDGE